MQATAGDVLTQVQRLLGEPAGSYYDLRYRLQRVNQAQIEMIQDALGAERELEIPLTGDDVWLPDDFLTFGKGPPYFKDVRGNSYNLKIHDPGYMQDNVFDWDNRGHGDPTYLVVDGTRRLRLSPAPTSGSLVVSYVPMPEPLWTEDDEIFSGDPALGRFSTALAYKVAAGEILAVSPQQGQMYLGMYDREMRHLREVRRTNTLRPQAVRAIKFYRSRR